MRRIVIALIAWGFPAMMAIAQQHHHHVHGQNQAPAEVLQFIRPGTTVTAIATGDVDGDGTSDYLMALENIDPPYERELLVLTRNKDGTLRLAATSSTILGCKVMQGAGGGIGLIPNGSGFEVDDYIGSGLTSGAKRLKFKYIKKDRDWLLIEVEEETNDESQVPAEHIKHTQTPSKQGNVIRFSEFNGDEYSVSCSP